MHDEDEVVLKAGDIVWLRSEGGEPRVRMTVKDVREKDATATVLWYEREIGGGLRMREQRFPQAALHRAEAVAHDLDRIDAKVTLAKVTLGAVWLHTYSVALSHALSRDDVVDGEPEVAKRRVAKALLVADEALHYVAHRSVEWTGGGDDS